MLKILTFSSLYPNPSQPRHGIFVETRLRQMLNSGELQAKVVAPVPWYPKWMPDIDRYDLYKTVPRLHEHDSLQVLHPRYPVIPAIGMSIAPVLMAAAVMRAVRNLYREAYPFDLIDAHYFYPDGVAAAIIAGRLGVPLTITARGTDINLIPKYAIPRRQILWAARRASAMVTVCDALRDRLIALGVDGSKITTLRNGVDPSRFYPIDREAARRRLNIDDRTLLSVGHLIERKGHHWIIEAMRSLDGYRLVIVGAGEWESKLRGQAERLGVADRVRFAGEVPQEELKYYYSACDATILASSREGMANVLLESIACGCPLVATDVWGTPEIVSARDAGVLIPEPTPDAICDGVHRLFADLPDRRSTHEFSRQFYWQPTVEGQLEIFRSIAASGGAGRLDPAGTDDAAAAGIGVDAGDHR